MSLSRHFAGGDSKDNRATVPLADFNGSFTGSRKVDVVPLLFREPVLADQFEEPICGPMEEVFGRGDRSEVEIDLEGVALIGANAQAVVAEREALLVALGDDGREFIASDGYSGSRAAREQFGDSDPTGGVESEAGLGRLMS